jgi:hypothetical protein
LYSLYLNEFQNPHYSVPNDFITPLSAMASHFLCTGPSHIFLCNITDKLLT